MLRKSNSVDCKQQFPATDLPTYSSSTFLSHCLQNLRRSLVIVHDPLLHDAVHQSQQWTSAKDGLVNLQGGRKALIYLRRTDPTQTWCLCSFHGCHCGDENTFDNSSQLSAFIVSIIGTYLANRVHLSAKQSLSHGANSCYQQCKK